MSKEYTYSYKEKEFVVKVVSGEVLVESDDFIITAKQLEALIIYVPQTLHPSGILKNGRVVKLRGKGRPEMESGQNAPTVIDIRRELKLNSHSMHTRIDKLKKRNERKTGRTMYLAELAIKANEYGLLHELSLIGLKTILNQQKKKK